MATRAPHPSAASRSVRSDTVQADDYPQSEVPIRARRGFWSVFAVLVGFVFFSPTMVTGAQISAAFAFNDLLLVVTVGTLILGTYVAVLSLIGARTGLTAVLLARYALGRNGAKFAALLLGGTQVCWYAVTAVFLGRLLTEALGWEAYTQPIILLGAALTGLTAYYGYRGLEILSSISVPLMFALCIWVLVQAFERGGGWSGLAAVEPTETMAWASAVTIVVGTFVSGGTQTPNWSRFARSPSHAFFAAFGAFFMCNFLLLFFGATGALAFGESDFVGVLLKLNMVLAAVFLLVFNLWTTQENTAYAFGVAGAEIFNVAGKRPFIIGGVVVAMGLALTGIYDALPQYLALLGIFIPPLGGAIIGDYLFTWRGRLPAIADTVFRDIRWSGVAAYVVGAVVAFTSDRLGIGLPPVHGIVASVLAVPVAERVFRSLGMQTRHVVSTPASSPVPGSPEASGR